VRRPPTAAVVALRAHPDLLRPQRGTSTRIWPRAWAPADVLARERLAVRLEARPVGERGVPRPRQTIDDLGHPIL